MLENKIAEKSNRKPWIKMSVICVLFSIFSSVWL